MVVIGGGVSGLAAASRLRTERPDVEVVVLERAREPGGWLRTTTAERCTIELGPDSILREDGTIERVADRLGIAGRLVSTRADRHGAYVVRGGRLVRVPRGWSLLAPSDLPSLLRAEVLSAGARARAALEPLVPRAPLGARESLAAFVRRRLGWEPLERLAQPLAGGIYGADAELLGLDATMPRFAALEREHGSLLRALARGGGSSTGAPASRPEGARYGLFVAFDEGMRVLVEAYQRSIGRALATGVEARAVLPEGPRGELVVVTDRANMRADAVIVALPAPAGARILRGAFGDVASALERVRHGSAATVTFVVRRDRVAQPLDAYGFVVPAVERRRILASTWSSEKWPGRAPEELAVLRVFVGDADERDMTAETDEALERTALRELRELCGVTGDPLVSRVVRYPSAMPRYGVEHARDVGAVEGALARAPGLFVAGNSLHGVGIPAAIRAGERAADAAAHFVAGARSAT